MRHSACTKQDKLTEHDWSHVVEVRTIEDDEHSTSHLFQPDTNSSYLSKIAVIRSKVKPRSRRGHNTTHQTRTGNLQSLCSTAVDNLVVPSVTLVSILNRSEEHTSELQSRPHLVCRL